MIDGLNVFIAGLEAKWCAFTQQEHHAALARELDLPKYTKFSTAWYGRVHYWHVTTKFHTKFSMPEVKYGYVAIKVYGHVNCDHKTVRKPRKHDRKQLSCTAVGT